MTVTRFSADRLGRYPASVEHAVYFTCMEALQNAAKHADPGTSVIMELADDGEWLSFSVLDEGSAPASFDGSGQGLANMRERMAACGGEVRVESRPGAGVTVRGRLPLGLRGSR